MYHRSAVLPAVAGLLACSGLALADAPKLSLDPAVITADSTAPQGLLMQGLDKAGAAKTLADAKLNIYGWVESGYTYNHRHAGVNTPDGSTSYEDWGYGGSTFILPGPFNDEYHNHLMLNQFVLRFERQVDTKTFDIGGMIELMYGSDADSIHATGLGYSGSDATDDNRPVDYDAVDNLSPNWQFDIPQAYLTVNLPIGNGLQLLVGKFVTLLGYETIDPRGNPFYTHSFLFSAVPYTHTGILGSYQLNDQLGLKLGITRGWDIALEDNNGCAIDVLGQVSYKFSQQVNFAFNFSVGPENGLDDGSPDAYGDSSHYRTVLNPILYWQATDALKIGVEVLYLYDGGINGSAGYTHAYGDIWGAALYAGYKVNDNLTFNLRAEKAHSYVLGFGGLYLDNFAGVPTLNAYEATIGATITPMPKCPYLKGLSIRPEIRYDWCEDDVFGAKNRDFQDQLTFAADVIFAF